MKASFGNVDLLIDLPLPRVMSFASLPASPTGDTEFLGSFRGDVSLGEDAVTLLHRAKKPCRDYGQASTTRS